MSAPALTLLSRPGCGLCEEFMTALVEDCPAWRSAVRIVDVDSRPGWAARWGTVIPVLLDDEGTVICETFFDAEALRAWAAGRTPAPG